MQTRKTAPNSMRATWSPTLRRRHAYRARSNRADEPSPNLLSLCAATDKSALLEMHARPETRASAAKAGQRNLADGAVGECFRAARVVRTARGWGHGIRQFALGLGA